MPLLTDYLRQKLIPWMNQKPTERFIVARQQMQQAQMPSGVVLSRRAIKGERVVIKNRRYYSNVRAFSATYPDAGLIEMEIVKLVVILEGRADYQMGHHAVKCGPGYFLIVPPGVPTPEGRRCPYNAAGHFCTALLLTLYPHAVQAMLTRSDADGNYTYLENYLFQEERLVTQFRLATDEIAEARNEATAIGSFALAAFWLALQREMQEGKYLNPGPIGRPAAPNQKEADFTGELLDYIQSRLNQPLSLEAVAKGMHLSRTQFIRRVRQETGKSFVEFLNDYRIEEAKNLLRDSDWTVTAIAGFLGFKSPTYLQRVFRDATGTTPTQFRSEVRSKKVR